MAPGGGAELQFCGLDAELCGAGAAAAKSVALSPVSVQPLPARTAAAVFVKAGAEPGPSKSEASP